jgi:hypothetical protein
MDDRCRLYRLKGDEITEYCQCHLLALIKSEEAHETWRKSHGMGWEEFLSTVSENEEIGGWARDVAVDLLKNTRSLNCKHFRAQSFRACLPFLSPTCSPGPP